MLTVDDGSQREVVEGIIEILPHVGATVLLHCLLVKPIHTRHLPGLMIPSEQEYLKWIQQFVGEEKQDRFKGVVPAVDIIADEQVLPVRKRAANLEEF